MSLTCGTTVDAIPGPTGTAVGATGSGVAVGEGPAVGSAGGATFTIKTVEEARYVGVSCLEAANATRTEKNGMATSNSQRLRMKLT
jgi:hypothetical protein